MTEKVGDGLGNLHLDDNGSYEYSLEPGPESINHSEASVNNSYGDAKLSKQPTIQQLGHMNGRNNSAKIDFDDETKRLNHPHSIIESAPSSPERVSSVIGGTSHTNTEPEEDAHPKIPQDSSAHEDEPRDSGRIATDESDDVSQSNSLCGKSYFEHLPEDYIPPRQDSFRSRSVEPIVRENGSPIRNEETNVSSIANPVSDQSTPESMNSVIRNSSVESMNHRETQSFPNWNEHILSNNYDSSNDSINSTSEYQHTPASKPSAIRDPRVISNRSFHRRSENSSHSSPLDRLHTPRRPTSIRLRNGILPFNDPDSGSDSGSDDESQDNVRIGDNTVFRQRVLSHRSSAHSPAYDGGLRREQEYTKKLESELIDTRLKLQQYREAHGTDQEFARMKHQVSIGERHIDELSESLERKNAVISQLSAERDEARHQYETDIMEIQQVIEQMEQSSSKNSVVISEAAEEIPDHVSPSDGPVELLAKIKELLSEQNALKSNVERETQASIDLNDKYLHLQGVTSALDKTNSEMRVEISRLREENLFLSREVSSLAEQNRALQSSKSENRTLTGQLHDIQGQMRDKNTLIAKLEGEIRALGDEERASRHEFDALQQSLAEKLREFQVFKAEQQATSQRDSMQRAQLSKEVADLHRITLEAKSASYNIVRGFFETVFEIMGTNYQNQTEAQIEEIVAQSRSESRSKIPLLTELLVEHARSLATHAIMSQDPSTANNKIWILESEIAALKSTLEARWTQIGANKVLIARTHDLERQLKITEEKRKAEWMEHRRKAEWAERSAIERRI